MNNEMKNEYDLSEMKSRKNPYAPKLKTSVAMRKSKDIVRLFLKALQLV